MAYREPKQEIPAENAGPPAQRNVSLIWPEYERLGARCRKVAAAENRKMSLGKTVTWLMDLADKLEAQGDL